MKIKQCNNGYHMKEYMVMYCTCIKGEWSHV